MGGGAKTVVAVLVVIAILIPILLGIALVNGLPYTTPTSTAASTNTSSASPGTIIIPLGAGGAQKANFDPASITVAPGTVITWQDQDSDAIHNIYFTSVPTGASMPSPNPSPNLNKGSTFSVTLTTAGTYKYECQYHSGWMQGTITVS
jgi:plastocyanin